VKHHMSRSPYHLQTFSIAPAHVPGGLRRDRAMEVPVWAIGNLRGGDRLELAEIGSAVP
jgi:hypothetical protein